MPDSFADHVAAVLASLSGAGERLDSEQLHVYLQELFRWNPQLGLVSKRDTPAVVGRLILQSVRMWDAVCDTHEALDREGSDANIPGPVDRAGGTGPSSKAGRPRASSSRNPIQHAVDIGSGGGFPGLVWKLLSPDLRVLLVERKERKAAFLERVIALMKLDGVSAVAADVRDVSRQPSYAHAFDVAVMMAVSVPEDVANPIEQLIRAGGLFCTLRGRNQHVPPPNLGRRLSQVAQDDTPHGRIIVYRKLSSD